MASDRSQTLLAALNAAVVEPDPVRAAWDAGLVYRRASQLAQVAGHLVRRTVQPGPSCGLTPVPATRSGLGLEVPRLVAVAFEAQRKAVRAREELATRAAAWLDPDVRCRQTARAALGAVMMSPAMARLPGSVPKSVRVLAVPAGDEPTLSDRVAWYAAARLDEVTTFDWRHHLDAIESGDGAADPIPREAVEAARDWHARGDRVARLGTRVTTAVEGSDWLFCFRSAGELADRLGALGAAADAADDILTVAHALSLAEGVLRIKSEAACRVLDLSRDQPDFRRGLLRANAYPGIARAIQEADGPEVG